MANPISRLDVSERRKHFFMEANSRNKTALAVDAWTDGQAKVRGDENDGYLQFPNHRTAIPGSNPARRDYWMNGGMKTEDHQEMRRVMMEEKGGASLQTRTSIREMPENFYSRGQRNSSSHLQIGSLKPQTSPDLGSKRIPNGESCHNMYRPLEHNVRYAKTLSYYEDTSAHNSRGRNGHHPFDKTKSGGLRNVTFDLGNLITNQVRNNREEERRPGSGKEKIKERSHKDPSSRPFKVKLNLNPLRKSKVQPRLKAEQGHTEKSPPKSSKKKKRDEKERLENHKKGKSGKKSKNGSEKKKKMSEEKVKNGEKEKNQEGDGDQTSAKQKETTNHEDSQKSADPGQSDNTLKPAEHQAASADAPTQSWHGFQYPAAAPTQLPSKHPFSLISADRNSTSNLSLLGTTTSPLIGSNLSLQGGNTLLKLAAPGMNTPGSPANFPPSGITLGGLNLTPRAPGGTVSLVPSLQSNQLLAQALQASAMPAAPAQSQLVPENSLAAVLKHDPGQVQAIPTEGALLQMPTESQASWSKQSPAEKDQEDTGGATSQPLQGLTTVENILTNNNQTNTGSNPEDPTAITATGGADKSEETVVEDSAPSTSSQILSSSEAAAALLQQEYLSAEGDSSPRRRLRLVLPEKTSDRPPTALERKIR